MISSRNLQKRRSLTRITAKRDLVEGRMPAKEIRVFLTVWLAPPLSVELGECVLSGRVPAEEFVLVALNASAQQINSPTKQLIRAYCLYNRTKQLFLDIDGPLDSSNVTEDDHLVVSLVLDQKQLDERFAPQKPDLVDEVVKEILSGR